MSKRLVLGLVALGVLAMASPSEAKLVREAVPYREGDQAFEGLLVYDDAVKGKRPAVMVVHEWWGLNDYPKHRAEELAKQGYVAFAADMYGKGVVATTPEEASKLAGALRSDRARMRARARMAWDVLARRPEVDPARMAAMGYCFGGGVALELARSGADMAGVVSFHGSLDTPQPEASRIKGKVLVLHGAEDKAVTMQDVLAFQDEMRRGRVNYQINLYGGAVHAFSNPAAGNDPAKGVAYDAQADKRSWAELLLFLREIFGR
ncbi:MAG TPA: dienelactone hydrolase family protein [Pantanalinema sp.]